MPGSSRRLIIIGAERWNNVMRDPLNGRSLLAFVHDTCAAALAWAALYWLRFNLEPPSAYFATCGARSPGSCRLQASDLRRLRAYRGMWRFASSRTCSASCSRAAWDVAHPVVLVMLQMQTSRSAQRARALSVVLIFLMAGSRFTYRVWKEHRCTARSRRWASRCSSSARAKRVRGSPRTRASREWRVVGPARRRRGRRTAA
jgi:FlaA1/EpsC-like NDP-sugar epimerase